MEQNRKISTGDVVKLKSGGYPMTVEKVDEATNIATCVWFDGAGNLGPQIRVHIASLVLTEERTKVERDSARVLRD